MIKTRKTLTIVLLFLLLSCGKDEDINEVINNQSINNEISFNKASINRLKEVKIEKKELGDGIQQVTVTDLYAYIKDNKNNDQYLKFNLEKAKWVKDDNWDIAFYGRSILINGGVPVITTPYSAPEPTRTGDVQLAILGKLDIDKERESENLVPISKLTDGDYLTTNKVPQDISFIQDKKNNFAIDDNSKGMFEYNYSPLEHVVTVKKNRFLIIKTINGHYAKLKLHSLYKDGGKTATKAITMEEATSKYFVYYTFTYNYNTKKGDKKLK